MKNSLFCFVMLFCLSANAQNNEGSIVYEDKFNIHKTLPPEMEMMKDRIPEFRTSKKVLSFKDNQALYKKYESEEKKPSEFRRRGYRWRMGGADQVDEYYTNLGDNSSVDRKEFFGKEFLIEGERDKLPWKITAEQKQVGSYLCQKAIMKDSTTTTVAWFTPMIPVATGPDNYYGLPGVILHVDVNEGERLITAQNIELKALEEEIERPKKGKKVTKEEFEKIREDKMAEMEKERSGQRGRFMITRG